MSGLKSSPHAESMTEPSTRLVPCPACGANSRYGPDNPFRPFCSERCRLMDLGAWADERFRLQAQPSEADQEPRSSNLQ